MAALLLKLTSLLSLGLAVMAAQHNIHLNRNHHDALAKRAPGHVELHRRFSNAKFSYYDAQTGNKGACGTFIGNGDFAVALNTPQYGGGYPGPNCFKKVSISFGGKTATATILDQCPGCPYGGLDLTPGLFAYFASHDRGIIYGEWHFVGDGDSAPAPAPTTTKRTTTTQRPTTTWTPPTTTRTTTRTTPTTTWTPPTTSSTSTRTRTSTSSTRTSSTPSSTSSSTSASSTASANRQASSTSTANLTGPTSSANTGSLSDLNDAFVRLASLAVQGAIQN